MVSTLVSICIGSPRFGLGHTIKTSCMKLENIDPEKCSIMIFLKMSGTRFSITFCAYFFMKNVSFVIFYQLTEFHCLIVSLLEISDNMFIVIVCYSVCDVMKFEIYLSSFIKPFYYMIRNSEQKMKYLKNENNFQVK